MNDRKIKVERVQTGVRIEKRMLKVLKAMKVGVKCSIGCNLAGEEIEIYDHEGARVATGTLGGVVYSDTIDLYWAEVELTSPTTKGIYRWEAKLSKPGQKLAHGGACFTFGFSTANQPEHTVTIEAVDQDTKAPVTSAHVTLRPYSGHTDDQGVVKLDAASAEYKLYVTKGKYETFQTTVIVDDDATIQAELVPALYEEDYRGNLWKVERK